MALLRSVDGGVTWTDVDHSVLEADDSLTAEGTTPSGLTWLRPVLPTEDGGDVLTVIDGDRLVDAHLHEGQPCQCHLCVEITRRRVRDRGPHATVGPQAQRINNNLTTIN
jgi:hypothetical protein